MILAMVIKLPVLQPPPCAVETRILYVWDRAASVTTQAAQRKCNEYGRYHPSRNTGQNE
jgi:hypothetical protein